MNAGIAEFLSELARGAPWLPGARCRGRAHLFSPAEGNIEGGAARQKQALQLCRGCPSLTTCRQWLDGLAPESKPSGVVAGQVLGPPLTRKTYVR